MVAIDAMPSSNQPSDQQRPVHAEGQMCTRHAPHGMEQEGEEVLLLQLREHSQRLHQREARGEVQAAAREVKGALCRQGTEEECLKSEPTKQPRRNDHERPPLTKQRP